MKDINGKSYLNPHAGKPWFSRPIHRSMLFKMFNTKEKGNLN